MKDLTNIATCYDDIHDEYVCSASEAGFAPGDWPLCVQIDDTTLTRVGVCQYGARYMAHSLKLTVFND